MVVDEDLDESEIEVVPPGWSQGFGALPVLASVTFECVYTLDQARGYRTSVV